MKSPSDRRAAALVLLAMLLLFVPATAEAYLDPGAGSYVVQLLIGGLLGGLFATGVFWRRVVARVRSLFQRRSRDDGGR